MNRPWMPLYIADYLKKTTHLGALESGAYLHLIMDYWQNGKLPTDDKQLARIAKLSDREWKRLKTTLQAFFRDGWQHERVDEELAEAGRIAQSNSGKAREAANQRWAKHRSSMQDASSEHASSNAPECTLHTSPKKDITPDGVVTTKAYAFESGVIKLSKLDFDLWRASFSHLDLAAELLGLTEWAQTQRNWFHAVKGALTKRNREVGIAKSKAKDEPGFKWNGIEGVI